MRAADLLPRGLLRPISTLLQSANREEEIQAFTGLTREQWRELSRAFPRLGSDPGPSAARARRKLQFLIGRALQTPRHGPRFRPAPPGPEPTVYVTAHLADLRALRYLMRRHLDVASVVSTTEEEREAIAREDRTFDERVPRDFPHAFSLRRPHRLRSALSRGSLIAAADAPEGEGVRLSCLGGSVRLDRRPFRLARLAGVPCRALFLTAPAARLTVTIGEQLPREETPALAAFAEALGRVADESPLDLDGPTWWNRLRRP